VCSSDCFSTCCCIYSLLHLLTVQFIVICAIALQCTGHNLAPLSYQLCSNGLLSAAVVCTMLYYVCCVLYYSTAASVTCIYVASRVSMLSILCAATLFGFVQLCCVKQQNKWINFLVFGL
jgi:hypothetical protein